MELVENYKGYEIYRDMGWYRFKRFGPLSGHCSSIETLKSILDIKIRKDGTGETEKPSGKTLLKDYYMFAKPNDVEMHNEINGEVTFEDLFIAIDQTRQDVYELIGVGDSVVRETLFHGLAEVTQHTYKEVYDRWLGIGG